MVQIPRIGKSRAVDEDTLTGEFRDWDRVRFQVNLWTHAEMPRSRITSSKLLSIGEEQSNSYIVSIQWSPPGLARYGRCALAVHTSNLRLAIWAADGNPSQSTSWKRRLIVNSALGRYLGAPTMAQAEGITPDLEASNRIRRRVRQYAWCPPTRNIRAASGDPSRNPGEWSDHLLVVSNDDNDVVFLRLATNRSTSSSLDWSTEVLTSFKIALKEAAPPEERLFDLQTILRLQRHVIEFAWSPWYIRDQNLEATLAYTTASHLCFRRVHFTEGGNGNLDVQVSSFDVFEQAVDVKPTFPLRWCPRKGSADELYLLFSTMNKVTCYQVMMQNSDMVVSHADLGGRYDAITGTHYPMIHLHHICC